MVLNLVVELIITSLVIFKKPSEIHLSLWIWDNNTKYEAAVALAISSSIILTDLLNASGIQQIHQFFLLPLLTAFAGVTAGADAW